MLLPSRGVLLEGRGGGEEVFFPPCTMKWRGSWSHYDTLKWNLNSAKKGPKKKALNQRVLTVIHTITHSLIHAFNKYFY